MKKLEAVHIKTNMEKWEIEGIDYLLTNYKTGNDEVHAIYWPPLKRALVRFWYPHWTSRQHIETIILTIMGKIRGKLPRYCNPEHEIKDDVAFIHVLGIEKEDFVSEIKTFIEDEYNEKLKKS